MSYEVLRSDGRPIPRLRCEVVQQAGQHDLLSVARVRVRRLSAVREIRNPHDAWVVRIEPEGDVPVFSWSGH